MATDNGRILWNSSGEEISGILLGVCFPFSILLLLYFRFAIFLYYRTLGDNVLGGGGMWWGKLAHPSVLAPTSLS